MRASLRGTTLFPWRVALSAGGAREVLEDFERVRDEIAAIQRGAENGSKRGYRIEEESRQFRLLGEQRLPAAAVFDTAEDLIAYLGVEARWRQFQALATEVLTEQPKLQTWLEAHPHRLLEYAEAWPKVLAVCRHLQLHPRPGVYVRALAVPGLSTKFVEEHRLLLREVLDRVLLEETIDHAAVENTRSGFERRFGFASIEPLVRFRSLDPARPTDMALPWSRFRSLAPPAERVLITENLLNFLSLPEIPGALAIFGQGYAVERLLDVEWLKERQLFYWGDMDTHGFAVLARLRAKFPGLQSILMDERTLLDHLDLCVEESASERHTASLDALGATEQQVYQGLVSNRYGHHVRLEQERIPFPAVLAALDHALARR